MRVSGLRLAIGTIVSLTIGVLFLRSSYAAHIIPWFSATTTTIHPVPFLFKGDATFNESIPPPKTFEEIRDYERHLPQHDPLLPFPEGETGRFVRFSNEIWALGLNNQLDNRQDVTFDHDWNNAKWNPLNTFISGPTSGGSFGPLLEPARIPRAVHIDFYRTVCSPEKGNHVLLQVTEVNAELGLNDYFEGVDLLEKWAKKLREMPEQCVEIAVGSPHIFDFGLMSSQPLLSLYPSFVTSPIITQFRWSDVVLHAVKRITPSIVHFDQNSTPSNRDLNPHRDSSDPLLSTFAIHLRRGDFADHCYNLANMGYPYNSWNLLPNMPDQYDGPIGRRIYDNGTAASREELNHFFKHCWPTTEQVVQRVKELAKEYYETPGDDRFRLSSVYILTNEQNLTFLAELKDSLLGIRLDNVRLSIPGHTSEYLFDKVTTSNDMTIIGDTENIAEQAIDMAIAERAGLFVGNGFSTLSANINLFRLGRGLKPRTCRQM